MMEALESLPLDALERIDQVCCQFEDALKKQSSVDLREFVAEVTGPERRVLLLELVSLDIDYRCRRQEPVSIDDYVALLPDDRDTIEQAFTKHNSPAAGDTNAAAESSTRIRQRGLPEKPVSDQPATIGRYRVLKQLAAGGSGVVYRGFDDELQRDVAIKVPHRAIVSSGQTAARFLTEARLVASLHHPAIVPVYDVGRTPDGQCYVVSKLMEGSDLSIRIRQAALTIHQAVRIVKRVADAIHYAHSRRLVHRDIKPSNLLCDAEGDVYVADFGAAVHERSGPSVGFIGTPAYMSPEQARCETHLVDARTDVYALGVVLYELLTHQRPFRQQNVSQLLADVISMEPERPRHLNPEIPVELERITLKAMSKKASDRYQTAHELAVDLQAWTDAQEKDSAAHAMAHATAVVPKGLRSFDESDAEYFLSLLPGARDRHGVPELVRFWQARVDEILPAQSFRVGVIYGPSGCGKSSLVKAGLLPRLGQLVTPIYLESRDEGTEGDLQHALQRLTGPQDDLVSAMRAVRSEPSQTGRKILIVIDQFEQWLHARRDVSSAELIHALRQCDGVRTQCLLMVRDDFWMPLVRFMKELEVPLLQHQNAMAVDLFEPSHAKKVLLAFGQAYERLPAVRSQLTREQKRFLDDAVQSLAQRGTVSPIVLSLFADMMKSEPWEPGTLRRVGGAEGLGVRFLDRCFSDSQTHPAQRMHQSAARGVLASLLPPVGVEIRAHARSQSQLLRASGYQHHPDQFQDLVRLLDQQLRLITPTEPDQIGEEHVNAEPHDGAAPAERFYQLSHDFMVSPIRDWVTKQQRQTVRGRAELCLAERTALWRSKPERRQLPGLVEWLQIRLFTESSHWNPAQRRMLRYATQNSLVSLVVLALIATVIGFASWQAIGRIRAHSAVATIRRANTDEMLDVINDVRPLEPWLTPLLQRELTAPGLQDRERRNISLALLENDSSQADLLSHELFHVGPRDLKAIRDGIAGLATVESQQQVAERLWQMIGDSSAPTQQRFRAACVLAGLAPRSTQWNDYAEETVEWLIRMPIDEVSDWLTTLQPVRQHLITSLERVFLSSEAEGTYHIAAFALASFLDDTAQTERIVELVKRARPGQLPALIETLREQGDAAVAMLKEESQLEFASADEQLPPNLKSATVEVTSRIQKHMGAVTPRFAFCQSLPFDDLMEVAESLREYGYRPTRIRPYHHHDQLLVAVIWTRDRYDWVLDVDLTEQQVRARSVEYQQQHHGLQEVSAYFHEGKWQFVAVWSSEENLRSETQVSLATEREVWQTNFDHYTSSGFRPQSIQYGLGDEYDLRLTQVWRKPTKKRGYEQRFSATQERLDYGGTNYVPLDVSAFLGWSARPFAVIWQVDPYLDSETVIADRPQELMARWRDLYRKGYRPTTIAVSSLPARDDPQSVTVWQRSVPTSEAKLRFADIKSNVLIALLTLGEEDSVYPHLLQTTDPTLRSYVIRKMPMARVPCEIILSAIQRADLHPDVRQSLLLALNNYDGSLVSRIQRQWVAEWTNEAYVNDADAGVHAALELLSRRWKIALNQPGPFTGRKAGHRTWNQTVKAHTMVNLDLPDDYQPKAAGMPPRGHRFAIGSTEVTVKQFAEFNPKHNYNRFLSASESCPANSVNWFEAAAYCNWLSEQEGLPASQWCYELNEEGEYASGMTIAEDYLERKGYRLPLAAEWLFAASTGSSSTFFFGDDETLLLDYGWLARNSQGILHPTGTLQPNLFGVFDVYGNVKEWSHSLEKPNSDDRVVIDRQHRSVLGACFAHFEHHVRVNYAKHGNPTELIENRNGFRLARTLHGDD